MKYQKFKKNSTQAKFLCYNKNMLKTKTKVTIAFIGILSVASGVQASNFVVRQASAENTTFQVNVVESLSVTVTTPDTPATGSINTFMRNDVGLNVTTNNAAGFTATMYANTGSSDSTNTSLTNESKSDALLNTMSTAQTRGSFSANQWGYSLGAYTLDGITQTSYDLGGKTYSETAAGNDSSNYYPLTDSSTPITIMDGATNVKSTGSQNIYFGAKADATKPAGTYSGDVVLKVVGGTTPSSDPVDPDNKPTTDTQGTNPYYTSTSGYAGSSTGATVYQTTSTASGNTAQTTEISTGDTRNSYSNPAGVTEYTSSAVNTGTPLATGLAVTAAVAATSGAIFFILAKRKKDDDEEEEEEGQA